MAFSLSSISRILFFTLFVPCFASSSQHNAALPSSISAAPAFLPAAPALAPDFTPLFPTPKTMAPSPSADQSSLPTIPSTLSPPNPDSFAPGAGFSLPSADLPASSSVFRASVGPLNLAIFMLLAVFIVVELFGVWGTGCAC